MMPSQGMKSSNKILQQYTLEEDIFLTTSTKPKFVVTFSQHCQKVKDIEYSHQEKPQEYIKRNILSFDSI